MSLDTTTKITAASAKTQELYRAACAAREKAYSPYSGHKVGAAIRTQDGKIYGGCNVENSSYGATVCAERVAIQSAIAQQGKISIAEIMVVTDSNPPWPPCGMCRQVITEFADSSIEVHASNLKGDVRTSKLGELFPQAFTPEHLSK